MAELAVLGTGIMGSGIARNLLRAGHAVRVWNRTQARATPLAAQGAHVAETAPEAAAGADVLVTMLADGPAVEAALGEGVLSQLAAGAVWLQMSTVGVAATDRLAALAAGARVPFVDAPVLGSKAQAEAGELVVLASGPSAAEDRCRELLDAVARRIMWLGEAGAGSRLKLVVNAWVLVTVENVAEAVGLAEALGLDPRRFLDAIEGGPLDMAYAHAKGGLILDREFAPHFPLEHAAKDLRLVLEAAGEEVTLAAVRAALGQFERAIELGHARDDSAAAWFATQRHVA